LRILGNFSQGNKGYLKGNRWISYSGKEKQRTKAIEEWKGEKRKVEMMLFLKHSKCKNSCVQNSSIEKSIICYSNCIFSQVFLFLDSAL
jgi:hypothetical protein